MRYSVLARDEDFVIAVREGRELARVEVLSGPDYQAVDDVEYFKRMLHGSLRVPREYLGQEGVTPGGILSNADVRAARVTMNLQREMRNGFEQIVRSHLAARGMPNPFEPELGVEMTIPSGIWELAAYEVLNARADYASRVLPMTSMRYCQENILKLTDDEIKEIDSQQKKDAEQEQAGEIPGYANPAPPMPEEPAVDGGEMAAGAPEAPPAGASESRKRKHRSQLEEWRYRRAYQNRQEITEKLEQLVNEDSPAGARERERRGFFEDLQDTAFSRRNGQARALPVGVGHRPHGIGHRPHK